MSSQIPIIRDRTGRSASYKASVSLASVTSMMPRNRGNASEVAMALAIISGLTPSRRRMYATGAASLSGDVGISEAIVSSAWLIVADISGYDRVVAVASFRATLFFPFISSLADRSSFLALRPSLLVLRSSFLVLRSSLVIRLRVTVGPFQLRGDWRSSRGCSRSPTGPQNTLIRSDAPYLRQLLSHVR